MSLSNEQLRQVVDTLFQKYDQNRNGLLELREVTLLINSSLRHSRAGMKFTMSDARDFMNIADKNHDEKMSKEELYDLFLKIFKRTT